MSIQAHQANLNTQIRNREIEELLQRLDSGRISETECVVGIADAIRAGPGKSYRAGNLEPVDLPPQQVDIGH